VALEKRVIVVGAGIGGLAAAIALHQVRLHPVVFERAPELREIGAGLSLWPNALKALGYLGLAESIKALSIREASGRLRSWDGRMLMKLESAELKWRLGDVTVMIHRADLLRALSAELPSGAVHLGAKCGGWLKTAMV
jgi:2-polyprenyl-6-methoxyphenol hydroxylase-like FAD-dependent oxidoreductase